MEAENHEGLIGCLRIIKDPGIDRTKRHPLVSVLFIGIYSVLCGTESWEQMEDFGNERREWLKGHVELPRGVPSQNSRPLFLRGRFIPLFDKPVGQDGLTLMKKEIQNPDGAFGSHKSQLKDLIAGNQSHKLGLHHDVQSFSFLMLMGLITLI